ncbi:cell number regulator 13-like [Curcuma longa]|uniref:cell number regulator 13-like n=1 Tax=Curcuma longa TaxID=136217 RepID=UPI003D9F13FC
MASSPWGPIGDAAGVAQLLGLDARSLISLIVMAAAKARMHKTKCKAFSDYLQVVSALIEPLNLLEFNATPATRAPLQRLEDELRRSYRLVRSCKDRSFLYLIIMAWKIEHRFRTAQAEIDRYLRLIPLVNLAKLHDLTMPCFSFVALTYNLLFLNYINVERAAPLKLLLVLFLSTSCIT